MRSKKQAVQKEEEEEDEVYEVERLVDHRVVRKSGGKKIMYLIKWKNYDDDSNTWENEGNIYSQGVINEYWERIGKPREEGSRKTFKRKRPAAQKSASITTPNTRARTRSTGSESSSPSPTDSDSDDLPDTSKEAPILSHELSTNPPEGLTWSEATKVAQVYVDSTGGLIARVVWSSTEESYIATSLLRNVKPSILFQFYESNLKFEPITEEK
ncbi:hypothetical protein BJV82DRAFT_628355 [Fennellomyces sp. T-0311]|nr:hypothetical protein BJV82DRAFT_628355 [Fennellomyces sp. T-0311]